MKYTKIKGKFYLVKDNGEVTNVELTAEQVANATEVTAPADDTNTDATDLEKVEDELKSFISSSVKESVGKAVKSINNIKNLDVDVKTAISEAFKGTTETKSMFATEDGKKSLTAEEVRAGLKGVTAALGSTFSFQVEDVKALSELNSLTGEIIQPERLPEIVRPNVRPTFFEQLCSVTSTTSNKVTYVEATDETGAPATTAEMTKFPEKDFEFAVFEAPVRKITVMNKASNEILEDAPQLVGKVRQWLNEDMNLATEDKFLFGAGGANDFQGIFGIAPSFNVTGTRFAASVVTPNELDVLRVALQQIANASKTRYMATEILMNPEDVTALDLIKKADGSYILAPFTTAEKTTVKGVRIVENPAIPAGQFLVGDFSKANIANRRGLTMQVATENVDDFEKDMISIRLSRRSAFYIRNNDLGAFVKGVFADAITAITAV